MFGQVAAAVGHDRQSSAFNALRNASIMWHAPSFVDR